MIVGIMQVELAIDWAESLKDKRRVVKSLRDSLHRRHQVSVSEIEDQDIWNRGVLGIAMVGSSGSAIGVTLDRVLERIRAMPDCEVTGTSREILHGWGVHVEGGQRNDPEIDDDLESALRARANEAMEQESA